MFSLRFPPFLPWPQTISSDYCQIFRQRSDTHEKRHGMVLRAALASHESGFKYTLAGICSVQHLTDGSSRPSSITLSPVWNCLSHILALLGKVSTPKFCPLKAERRRGGGGGRRRKSILLTHPPQSPRDRFTGDSALKRRAKYSEQRRKRGQISARAHKASSHF